VKDESDEKSLFSRIKKILPTKEKNGSETLGKKLTQKLVSSVSPDKLFPTWKQWKQLPKVLSKKERIISLIIFGVVVVSSGFLLVNLYLNHRVLVPAIGGEYTEGLIGSPQFINPLYSTLSDVDMDLTQLVYSGLLKWNQDEGLVTDLAESYSISEDQKQYTFTLREGALWHDGESVTASDVLFTIQSIKNLEYKSPLEISFRGVAVEQTDERTIVFTLEEPFTPFLSVLTVGIIPRHKWQEIPPKTVFLADLNLKPIGSGPYEFEKFTKDKKGNIKSYTLISNEDFYGEQVKIERLIFKFYSDLISAIDAIENKNIEGISFVPKELAEEFISNKHYDVYTPYLSQYTALFFNDENNEILEDDDIRQALALAINKQTIIDDALYSQAKIVNGPILEGYTGFHSEIVKIEQNLESANSLLDEAGWDMVEGEEARIKGATDEDEEPQYLVVTLTTVDQPEAIAAAEIIKEHWTQIGVKTNILTVAADYVDEQVLKPRQYEILLYGEILGADPDPYPFWHSSQINAPGLNLAMYSNRDVDDLLEEARGIADEAVRSEKYIEFQNLLAEDMIAIFLYQPTYTYLTSSKLQGINLDRIIIPSDRFADINNWYINTKSKLAW